MKRQHHGEGHSRLNNIWNGMRSRCRNANHKDYKYYGGRGIKVCEEWNNYINFRDWSLANGYDDCLTIDRIDVNKDYSPSNCRWVDRMTQMNNFSKNIVVDFNNESHTISDWSKILNIPYGVLYYRIKHNWKLEKAFNKEE